ncbi:M1 family aminopeptidase [Promethearchaeum syntrophicum]|uniref:M1 family aminopeptidase n=1 Tax=Promethearchaeum syntrophicum TaxID=2594042 RepID=A0A5B9D569_9ARCH|nr:M1 family metallopeptidase [Candidatus Prometheoarchaeum syntrophicum]
MDKLDDIHFRLKNHGDFASPNVEKNYRPSLELEPIHQIIKLKFDLPNKKAEGVVTTTIKANGIAPNHIKFDAMDLNILSVKGPNRWDYDGKYIDLYWELPFTKGEKRDATIEYEIANPITGMYFSYPDEKYPDRPKYAVTDNESIRARYWLPCVDHLSIRCGVDYFLTSNKEHFILANGKLVEERDNGNGTKTAHWNQSFPSPSYLLTLAVGEFIEYKDNPADAGKGKIPLAYYTTQNFKVEDLKRAFDKTGKYLAWFNKKLQCPLEWDKYYQIATAHHGGAMENISFVTWGDFAIVNEKESKEFQYIVDLINVHEMAHSWFGDMIVCNEFSTAYLKESFAVFMESIYFKENVNYDTYLYELYLNANKYMEESDNKYARPIVTNKYDSSWDMYDMHLYPGGAWRIHMLRNIVGENVFWEAVTDYLNTYKGKTVETLDFQRKLEEHSGLSLEAFFEQWFYSPGYPKLKVSFSYNDKTHLGSLKVEQTQEDKKKKIGIFKFPLDVKYEIDGRIITQTFQINEKEQTLFIRCDKKPKQIVLDPNFITLFSLEFNPGSDMLIHQLRSDANNIIDRIRAAGELAKEGKMSNLKAIEEAYNKTDFWGIKNQYAKILAKSPNFEGIKIIIRILETETDPMVLKELIGSLMNSRYEIVFEAMKKYLQREDKLYWATYRALLVMGSQRNEKAFEFLNSYQIDEDFKFIIQKGLNTAIGKTRSEKAIDYLLERLPYGKEPEYVRTSTISALGEVTQWSEKYIKEKVMNQLTDLLKTEKNENVIQTISRTLSGFKDAQVISSIENAKFKMATQDHPSVDRRIKSITKGKTAEKEKAQLQTDLDEIKKKMKKLFAKVEVLEANSKKY